MKSLSKVLVSLLVLMLSVAPALAQPTDNMPVATVNGEELLYSDYAAVEQTYIYNYLSMGIDPSDATVAAYIQDMALSTAIENLLLDQDMRAQGCFEFDEETEKWFVEQGTAAYEQALKNVEDMLRSTLELDADEDMSAQALQYAEELGVTVEDYTDVYRTQYATAKYYEWLNGGREVTDEDIQAAYDERVAKSRELYENNAAAFETALNSGAEVWYHPEGYRTVLQILLKAEGESEQEKLASVADMLNEIDERIKNGDDYKTIIGLYTADPSFENENFYEGGYPVHRDSVIWEDAFIAAAFSEEMSAPGCWSKPFVSELGVHILYYLKDTESGAVELTDEICDALSYAIYSERCQTLAAERLDELADAAQVIIH